MSIVEVQSFEAVSCIINSFEKYNSIFSPVFLQYNGKNQIISIQYRLRTLKNKIDRSEFLLNLIEQYIQNPIQIQSNQFNIEIFDQNSTENLAENREYCEIIGNFFLLKLEELLEIDSETINIYINSKVELNLNSVIKGHISKQPKQLENYKTKYQLISFLQNNDLPPKFQCLNVPVIFKLALNDFINYFIPKKILIARSKWYNAELQSSVNTRKKQEYARMIENRYGISPLEFGKRLHQILNEILNYFSYHYNEIIEINNEIGTIRPIIPDAYHLSDNTGIAIIDLKFFTDFDQNNCGIKSELTFNFKWMKNIFDNYLKQKKSY